MEKFRQILELSLLLASEGKVEDALTELERGLEFAFNENNYRWVVHFSRNAGLICDQMGNLNEAIKYYKVALKHSESDPSFYYVLGELYERLGKKALSHRYFKAGYNLAVRQNDKGYLEVYQKVFEERGYKKPRS